MVDHVLNSEQLEAAIALLGPLEQVIARRVLMTDRFSGCWCVRCGYDGALFTVLGVSLGLCPRCVARRVDMLREDDFPLPDRRTVHTPAGAGLGFWPSLARLEVEALAQVREQDRKLVDRLEVRLDPPLRCRRCRSKVAMEEGRCLPSPAGTPFVWCAECWGAVLESADEPRADVLA